MPIVLDAGFERLCMVDDYTSFIWTSRYYEPGDFELSVPLTCDDLQYLQLGNYVARDDASDVGIIERREVTTDINNNEIMVISGRFLSSIIGRRIIAKQTQVSGTIAQCVTKLLNENAINPTDTARKLPLSIGSLAIPATSMQQQFTGTNLLDAITNIAKTYSVGYQVTLNSNNAMVFGMYAGVDRSYSQSANTWAVFSSEYGNLESADYVESTSDAVTNVLVAGEGEGLARKTAWATVKNPRGLDRYELYVDARNASTNNGEISDNVYLAQLRDEGLEQISDLEQLFAGNVSFSNIDYGQDLYVGDICTLESVRWGLYVDARLVEVIESTDEGGAYTITPTFEIGAGGSSQDYDTSAYLMSESSLDLMTEQDAGPLMAEYGTFDAASSVYDHAVKISELDEASESDIQSGHWLALARATDTVKLAWSTLVSKLKSIFLPLTGGTLSGSLSLSSGGVSTNTAAFIINDSRLDRVGGVSSNVYSAVHGIRDKNGKFIGYVQATQYPSGTTGVRFLAANEKEDGTEVGNTFEVQVKKDGSKAYYVTDAAAFREAINAASSSNQTTMEAGFTAGSGSQVFNIFSRVVNSSSDYLGKRVGLIITPTDLSLYNSTDQSTIWKITHTVTSDSTGTGVVTAASGFTVYTAGGLNRAFKRNGVATVYLGFTTTNALTAGTTYLVGTLSSEWRPYGMAALSVAGTRYQYNANTQANGQIRIVPAQNISAGATFYLGGTFVQA